MNHKFLLLFVTMVTVSSPMLSFAAGWELYDDFSSGTLDPQKWSESSTVSTITVESQRVKIIHLTGYPEQSGWLHLVQDQDNILGIKASLTISSCTGDVRARFGGHAGTIGENRVWSTLTLQPGFDRIYAAAGLEGPSPNYIWLYDLHYGQFQRPLDLLGNTYNASVIFSSDRITYGVDGLGRITYKYATNVDPTKGISRSIGTRSTNGDGPCTIYVDNVYVLRP